MKSKYLIIAALLTISSFSVAQGNLEEGKYIPIPELKEMEGLWAGSSNTSDSLIIELKSKKEFLRGPNIYIDQLSGKYYYYKNGLLIEESPEKSLSSGSISQKNPSILLSFTFWDNRKQKAGDIIIDVATFKSTSAKWNLNNKEGIVIIKADGKTVDGKIRDQNFSIPTEMILTKIK